MDTRLGVSANEPKDEEILSAEATTYDILRRSTAAIDSVFSRHSDSYAVRNPDLVASVARIMFDELVNIRSAKRSKEFCARKDKTGK